MFESASRIDISHIAKQLRMRQAIGLKTVLILGARTGGLFRSPKLYETLQGFALPAFSTSSQNEQFAQCYHIVTKGNAIFSPSDIQSMLRNALAQVPITEADRNLAALILQGYFDPIITTNADRLLEQALTRAGWQELQDFEVINLVSETSGQVFSRGRRPTCTVIKVFGELTARNYLLQERYAHMGRNSYRSSVTTLADILDRDCLVIGFDEAWDGTLCNLFPPQGGHCWLVAEEELDGRSPWHAIGSSRIIRSLIDREDARYENFAVKLYRSLTAKAATDTPTQAPAQQQESLNSVEPQRDGEPLQVSPDTGGPLEIFISYHQKDEAYLQQLVSHLATMEHQQLIRTWFPQKIEAGQSVAEKIQLHLNRSTIILLLVSSDFIASTDIYTGEVKRAIELHRAGKASIIPILIRPVDWETTDFGSLAPLPTNKTFVTKWNDHDDAFQNIAQGIRKVVDSYSNQKPS